ncbi:MAG: hypothetical protein LC620_07675, partial [Halobacteriales archaeon]|nr:hypothetical protein [Halobacteriales archaeon]
MGPLRWLLLAAFGLAAVAVASHAQAETYWAASLPNTPPTGGQATSNPSAFPSFTFSNPGPSTVSA